LGRKERIEVGPPRWKRSEKREVVGFEEEEEEEEEVKGKRRPDRAERE
jgi:hypothetical protein